MLVLLSVVLSLLVLFGERRDLDVRRGDVARMTGWGIPGLAAGILVLRAVDKPVLQVGVGVAVIAAALIELRGGPGGDGRPRPGRSQPVGVVAGLLTTTTGVNGPPMIMYYLRTGGDQHQVRDSMAATFLALHAAGGRWRWPLGGRAGARATSARPSWPGCWPWS